MPEHSPEPWTAVSGTEHTRYSIILYCHTGSCPEQAVAKDVSKADASRIIACVNALAGIEDPEKWVDRAKGAIHDACLPFQED